MRYAPSHYAQAFTQLMIRYPQRGDALCDGLVRTLVRNGDRLRAPAVIAAIEKELMRHDGVVLAEVVSAHPLSVANNNALRAAIGESAIISEQIDPRIEGGVKIIINETTMVDATLARKLKELFPHALLTV